MASAMDATALNPDMDHLVVINSVIVKLYNYGSDDRTAKRTAESRTSLGTCIYEKTSTKIPAVIGLWGKLPREIRDTIRSTKQSLKLPVEIQILVVQLLLKYANTYSDNHYCFMSKVAITAYNEFLRSHDLREDKLLPMIMNFRSVFEDQERQVVDPNFKN